MPDFKIFTESKADIKFISDYVAEHFAVTLEQNTFYKLDSWSGYKKGGDLIAAIRQNSEAGNRNILILDADIDIAHRRAELLSDFEKYNIQLELFLFPNNEQNGALETTLCAIAVEQNILNCFEGYEACVVDYEAPVIKSKVFAYLDALLPAANKKNDKQDLIQDANRNYRNPEHWNLHHDYLQPLHNFLSPFFSEA